MAQLLGRDNKGRFIKGHPFGVRFGNGQKMWKPQKGIHLSPITEFKKGQPSPRKGKHQWFTCTNCRKQFYPDDQVKRKYCPECRHLAIKKGKDNYFYGKSLTPWNKGMVGVIKKSELAKEKMRAYWENKEWREKQIERMLAGLFKRPTSLEQQMIDIIKKNNLPYKYVGDGSFIIGYKNPDFVNINGEKKLIEVANLQHHSEDYPIKRAKYFSKYGWKSYIFRTKELDENIVLKTLKEEK